MIQAWAKIARYIYIDIFALLNQVEYDTKKGEE